MKKKFVALFGWLLLQQAHGQTVIVQPGASIQTSGPVNLVLDNISLQSTGKLNLTSCALYLKGSGNNIVQSNNSLTLKKLVIGKNSSVAYLKTALIVSDSIVMKAGLLDLNGYNITLQPNAVVTGETESNRITGTNGGSISITTALTGSGWQNPGNLGFSIGYSANKTDSITIMRSHKMQYGAGMSNSILRSYDVVTKNKHLAAFRFRYLDAELNGQNENNSDLFKSTNNGANWSEIFLSGPDVDADVMEKWGVTLSGRYTLSQLQTSQPVKTRNNTVTTSTIHLQVFPNPAVQEFTVALEKNEGKNTANSELLLVTDLSGRVVLQQTIMYNTPLKINTLNAGVYIIKIASHPNVFQKVVVQ